MDDQPIYRKVLEHSSLCGMLKWYLDDGKFQVLVNVPRIGTLTPWDGETFPCFA